MISVSDLINLVIAVGTLGGLIYIARQTSAARRQATGQFLFELDSQFRHFADLHSVLMSDEGESYIPPDVSIVWGYIGLFERCKVLIDHRTIDMKTFDAFYGYRLYSVVGNKFIRESVALSAKRHEHFIRLCRDVLRYKQRMGMGEDDARFSEMIEPLVLPASGH